MRRMDNERPAQRIGTAVRQAAEGTNRPVQEGEVKATKAENCNDGMENKKRFQRRVARASYVGRFRWAVQPLTRASITMFAQMLRLWIWIPFEDGTDRVSSPGQC